jgi:hypothetical protein
VELGAAAWGWAIPVGASVPLTEQQRANLAKGWERSKEIGRVNRARRKRGEAPPGRPPELAEARARQAAQDDRIEAAANSPRPSDVVREMFVEATKSAVRLYQRYNARGGEPPRIMVEVSREARQLAEEYRKVLEALGATAQADEFFARLETLLAEGPPNLAPRSGPRPYLDLEDPARPGRVLAGAGDL